jgi:hypothetical protein
LSELHNVLTDHQCRCEVHSCDHSGQAIEILGFQLTCIMEDASGILNAAVEEQLHLFAV